tara:strand:+ start:121 stop:372 length:252 start_codon:yes stop_codon:yes gene_type:complete
MSTESVISKLNTKFGIGEYEDYFKIDTSRLCKHRNEIGANQFRLSTNSGDNISSVIIESLGFKIIDIKSIIDARYITFEENKQ